MNLHTFRVNLAVQSCVVRVHAGLLAKALLKYEFWCDIPAGIIGHFPFVIQGILLFASLKSCLLLPRLTKLQILELRENQLKMLPK